MSGTDEATELLLSFFVLTSLATAQHCRKAEVDNQPDSVPNVLRNGAQLIFLKTTVSSC
jgi:hypothetical protein